MNNKNQVIKLRYSILLFLSFLFSLIDFESTSLQEKNKNFAFAFQKSPAIDDLSKIPERIDHIISQEASPEAKPRQNPTTQPTVNPESSQIDNKQKSKDSPEDSSFSINNLIKPLF